DRCLAFDQQEFPGRDIDCDYALHPAVLDDQVGAEKLVVALDGGVLVRSLEQRVQHVEAGLVRREPRALDLHAAEEADVDVAVVLAAPRTAPVLELGHFLRAMSHEVLDHVLVAQPVAAADGVVEVNVQVVVSADDAGRSAFRGHGMAAHGNDLGNEGYAQPGIALRYRDRRAQPRAAAADYHDICLYRLHQSPLPRLVLPQLTHAT